MVSFLSSSSSSCSWTYSASFICGGKSLIALGEKNLFRSFPLFLDPPLLELKKLKLVRLDALESTRDPACAERLSIWPCIVGYAIIYAPEWTDPLEAWEPLEPTLEFGFFWL